VHSHTIFNIPKSVFSRVAWHSSFVDAKFRVFCKGEGAHLLRHTAATEMLRHGVPLDQIGLVLRHRSIDTTAYYAKVDVALLKQVAQPWPEVKP
jgi:site-specific recombinase XerD